MAGVQYKINIQADASAAQRQVEQLSSSLQRLQQNSRLNLKIDTNMADAAQQAAKLQQALQQAVNVNTGQINFSALSNSLASANTNVQTLIASFQRAGTTGQQAISQLSSVLTQATIPAQKATGLIAQFGTTLMNTVKWQAASQMVHGLQSAMSGAVSYIENLNTSLNNIRVVTGKSISDMSNFAKEANVMAKSLSTSTKAYADAALIYYQQGDNDRDVQKKAQITLKAANTAFKANAAEMSEMLTAVWNSYKAGGDQLEGYVDVMAKLGSTTATSMEEIATALQKVAATASTVGVGMEQMSSIVATVSSVTRESAESIGTSFKTILARMGDLKLGETLEDGVNLGKVSSSLNSIGVQVLDATGNMRDMGDVITDLGNKWQTMGSAQKTAIAQVVAGKRQYTQLMALFENWDTYQKDLQNAQNSAGSLEKMQKIYEDSVKASKQRVQASKEAIFGDLINDQFLVGFNNALATALSAVRGLVNGLGGIPGILAKISQMMMTAFKPQMLDKLTGIGMAFGNFFGKGGTLRTAWDNMKAAKGSEGHPIGGIPTYRKFNAYMQNNPNNYGGRMQAISQYGAQKFAQGTQQRNLFDNLTTLRRSADMEYNSALDRRESELTPDTSANTANTMRLLSADARSESAIAKQELLLRQGHMSGQEAARLQQHIDYLNQRQQTMAGHETNLANITDEAYRELSIGSLVELEGTGTADKLRDDAYINALNYYADQGYSGSDLDDMVADFKSDDKNVQNAAIRGLGNRVQEEARGNALRGAVNQQIDQIFNEDTDSTAAAERFESVMMDENNPMAQAVRDFLPQDENEMNNWLESAGFNEQNQATKADRGRVIAEHLRDQIDDDLDEAYQEMRSIVGEDSAHRAQEYGRQVGQEEITAGFDMEDEEEQALNAREAAAQKLSKGLATVAEGAMAAVQGFTSMQGIMKSFESGDTLAGVTSIVSAGGSLLNTFATQGPLMAGIQAAGMAIAGVFTYMKDQQEKREQEMVKMAETTNKILEEHQQSNQELMTNSNAFDSLNKQFAEGALSVQEYSSALADIASSLGIQGAAVMALTGNYQGLTAAIQESIEAAREQQIETAESDVRRAEHGLENQVTKIAKENMGDKYRDNNEGNKTGVVYNDILSSFNTNMKQSGLLKSLQNANIRDMLANQYGINIDYAGSRKYDYWLSGNATGDQENNLIQSFLGGSARAGGTGMARTADDLVIESDLDSLLHYYNQLQAIKEAAKTIEDPGMKSQLEALVHDQSFEDIDYMITEMISPYLNAIKSMRELKGQDWLKQQNVEGWSSDVQESLVEGLLADWGIDSNKNDAITRAAKKQASQLVTTYARGLVGVSESDIAAADATVANKESAVTAMTTRNKKMTKEEAQKKLEQWGFTDKDWSYMANIAPFLDNNGDLMDKRVPQLLQQQAKAQTATGLLAQWGNRYSGEFDIDSFAAQLPIVSDLLGLGEIFNTQEWNKMSSSEKAAQMATLMEQISTGYDNWWQQYEDGMVDLNTIITDSQNAFMQERMGVEDVDQAKQQWEHQRTFQRFLSENIDENGKLLNNEDTRNTMLAMFGDKYATTGSASDILRTYMNDWGISYKGTVNNNSDFRGLLTSLSDEEAEYTNITTALQTATKFIETASGKSQQLEWLFGAELDPTKWKDTELAMNQLLLGLNKADTPSFEEWLGMSDLERETYRLEQMKQKLEELQNMRDEKGYDDTQVQIQQRKIEAQERALNDQRMEQIQSRVDSQTSQDDEKINAAKSAIQFIQSNLTSLDNLSFSSIGELEQSLIRAGVAAERVKEIIEDIQNADGDKEQIKAGMVAATEAALMQLSTLEKRQQEYVGLVTELDTTPVDHSVIEVEAEMENEDEIQTWLYQDGQVYYTVDGKEVVQAVENFNLHPDGQVTFSVDDKEYSDTIAAIESHPGSKIITFVGETGSEYTSSLEAVQIDGEKNIVFYAKDGTYQAAYTSATLDDNKTIIFQGEFGTYTDTVKEAIMNENKTITFLGDGGTYTFAVKEATATENKTITFQGEFGTYTATYDTAIAGEDKTITFQGEFGTYTAKYNTAITTDHKTIMFDGENGTFEVTYTTLLDSVPEEKKIAINAGNTLGFTVTVAALMLPGTKTILIRKDDEDFVATIKSYETDATGHNIKINCVDDKGEEFNLASKISAWEMETDENGQPRKLKIQTDVGIIESQISQILQGADGKGKEIKVRLANGTEVTLAAELQGAIDGAEDKPNEYHVKADASLGNNTIQQQLQGQEYFVKVKALMDKSNLQQKGAEDLDKMYSYLGGIDIPFIANNEKQHVTNFRQRHNNLQSIQDIQSAMFEFNAEGSHNTWSNEQKYKAQLMYNKILAMSPDDFKDLAPDVLNNYFRALDEASQSSDSATASLAMHLMDGLIVGLQNTDVDWAAYFAPIGNEIIAAFAHALGIASPSKLTMALAPFLIQGLQVGLSQSIAGWEPNVDGLGDKIARSILDEIQNAIGKISEDTSITDVLDSLLGGTDADHQKYSTLYDYAAFRDNYIANPDNKDKLTDQEIWEAYEQKVQDDAEAKWKDEEQKLQQKAKQLVSQEMPGREWTAEFEHEYQSALKALKAQAEKDSKRPKDIAQARADALVKMNENFNEEMQKAIAEREKDYYRNKEYAQSDKLSDAQKSYIDAAVNSAIATVGATDLADAINNHNEEFIAAVQQALNHSGTEIEFAVEEAWNTIKDVWASGLQAIYAQEQATAQAVLELWEQTFQAIADMRAGLAEGKSILESMFGSPDELAAYVQTLLEAGKTLQEIKEHINNPNARVDYRPFDFDTYNKSGRQRFLNNENGEYLDTTKDQYNENVRKYVDTYLAGELRDVIGKSLNPKLIGEYNDKAKAGDANSIAILAGLERHGLVFADQTGNYHVSEAAQGYTLKQEDFEAVLSLVKDSMYVHSDSELAEILATAFTEVETKRTNMADKARQEGEQYIDSQQQKMTLLQTAQQQMIEKGTLAGMSEADQAAVLKTLQDMGIVGEDATVASIGLVQLESATMQLAAAMAAAAAQIMAAMKMLQDGTASSFEIDQKTGKVTVKNQDYANSAEELKQFQEKGYTAVNQAQMDQIAKIQADAARQAGAEFDKTNPKPIMSPNQPDLLLLDDNGNAVTKSELAYMNKRAAAIQQAQQEAVDQYLLEHPILFNTEQIELGTDLANEAFSGDKLTAALHGDVQALTDLLSNYAQQLGIEAQEMENYVESIAAYEGVMLEWQDLEADDKLLMSEAAVEYNKATEALDALQKAREENGSLATIDDQTKSIKEQMAAYQDLVDIVNNFFKDAEVGMDFIKDNKDLISQWANGSVEAMEQLEAKILTKQLDEMFQETGQSIEDCAEQLAEFNKIGNGLKFGEKLGKEDSKALRQLQKDLNLTNKQMRQLMDTMGLASKWGEKTQQTAEEFVSQFDNLDEANEVLSDMGLAVQQVGDGFQYVATNAQGAAAMMGTDMQGLADQLSATLSEQTGQAVQIPVEYLIQNADAITAVLNQDGTITYTVQAPPPPSLKTVTGENEIDVPASSTMTVTMPGGGSMTATAEGQLQGSGTTSLAVPDFGTTGARPGAGAPSAPGGGGGGGGGGGKKKKKGKSKADLKRYHEVDETIKRYDSKLGQVAKKEEMAFGVTKVKLMREEIEKLNKQMDNYQERLNEAAAYASKDRSNVEGLAAQLGITLDFDEDGTIKNWEALQEKLIDWYNEHKDDEAESGMEGPDDAYQRMLKVIEDYEDSLAQIEEYQEKILEQQHEISEKTAETVETAHEWKIELADLELNALEGQLDRTEDILTNLSTRASLIAEALFGSDGVNLDGASFIKLNEEMTKLNELQQAFKAGEIDGATMAEHSQDIMEALNDDMSDIFDKGQEIQELFEDMWSKYDDELSRNTDLLDKNITALQTIKDISDLIGVHKTFTTTRANLTEQYNQTQALANIYKDVYETVLAQKELFDQKIIEADGLENLDAQQQADYYSLLARLKDTQNTYYENLTSMADLARQRWEADVEEMGTELDRALAMGETTLDYLQGKYDRDIEVQDRYLNTAHQLYNINKLNRQIEQAMADTMDKALKNQYEELQNVINQKAKSGQLTQYDVDMMQKQYELLEKQAALRDAQNAKDTVRLTRDENGNYMYQYTADQEKVDEATQEYNDVLIEINELSLDRVRELEEQMLEKRKWYVEQAKAIALDDLLNEEEKAAKLRELHEMAQQDDKYFVDQMKEAYANLTTNNEACMDAYSDAYYSAFKDPTEGINPTIQAAIELQDSMATSLAEQIDWLLPKLKEFSDALDTSLYRTGLADMTNFDEIIGSTTSLAASQVSLLNEELGDEAAKVDAVTDAWYRQKQVISDIFATIEAANTKNLELLWQIGGTEGDIATPNATGFIQYRLVPVQNNMVGYTDGTVASSNGTTVSSTKSKKVSSDWQSKIEAAKAAAMRYNSKLSGYASGGLVDYTGPAWVDGTPNKPELMLNAADTPNLLNTIDMLHSIDTSAVQNLLGFIGGLAAAMSSSGVSTNGASIFSGLGGLEQNVHISAEFPNATDRNEIIAAFDELNNRASQYINNYR